MDFDLLATFNGSHSLKALFFIDFKAGFLELQGSPLSSSPTEVVNKQTDNDPIKRSVSFSLSSNATSKCFGSVSVSHICKSY